MDMSFLKSDTGNPKLEAIASDILRPVRINNRGFILWMGFLLAAFALCIFAYTIQLRKGLIVTGLRDYTSWGVYIANFTFIVGIAAAGDRCCVTVLSRRDGKIIGKGCNRVVSGNDPTAHAEIVAIRQACSNINSYDLSGSVLFSTCEPCPMCFSAVYWAKIDEVVFSLSRHDAELMGFKDNLIYEEIYKDLSERNIRFTKVDHSSIKTLMDEWDLKPDKFHY